MAMASAISSGSPRIRVMPAACIATSAPVPMAMPTSACASAGASFTPSPTMATRAALALQPLDMRGLVGRQHLGPDVADAQRLGDRLGRAGIVAGQQDRLDAGGAQPAHRFRGMRLDRIGHRDGAEQGRRVEARRST